MAPKVRLKPPQPPAGMKARANHLSPCRLGGPVLEIHPVQTDQEGSSVVTGQAVDKHGLKRRIAQHQQGFSDPFRARRNHRGEDGHIAKCYPTLGRQLALRTDVIGHRLQAQNGPHSCSAQRLKILRCRRQTPLENPRCDLAGSEFRAGSATAHTGNHPQQSCECFQVLKAHSAENLRRHDSAGKRSFPAIAANPLGPFSQVG